MLFAFRIFQTCIHALCEESKAHICPCCRSEDYKTLLNKQLRGQVLSLRVKCQNDRCSWRGELGDLKRHLDTSCVMVEAECRHGCGTRLTRKELQVHEGEECPTLPVSVLVSKMKESMKKQLDELKKAQQSELLSFNNQLEELEGIASSLKKEEVYKQEIADLKDKFKVQEVKMKDLVEQDEQHKLELLEVKDYLQTQNTKSKEKEMLCVWF